jgi:hypothetical protein
MWYLRIQSGTAVAANIHDLNAYRAKWNVPDWLDRAAYGYVDSLGPHHLRWEFLRRTDYYRAAWDSGDFSSDLDFGLTEMFAPWVRGDELPTDFAFFDTSIVGKALDLDAMRQMVGDEEGDASFAAILGDRIIDLVNHGYVLIPFDPGYPIDNQVKTASSALRGLKAATGKSRTNRSRVRTYDDLTLLRAFDADNERTYLAKHPEAAPENEIATLIKIARVIFDKGLDIGDTPEGNGAHTYFINAVKYARRMAIRPVFERK